MTTPLRSVRILARLAALPLWLAPRSFRAAYGRELVATFARALNDERRAGSVAMARLWFRGLADAVRTAIREHGLVSHRPMEPFRGVSADLRVAWRSWKRAPMLPVAIVLTLALGLGLASAVFAFADGYLFRPLPFPDPEQLYMVRDPNGRPSALRAAEANALRQSAVGHFGFVDWGGDGALPDLAELFIGDERVSYRAQSISPGFAETIGIPLHIGRWFTLDEHAGASPVPVVLSHRFWQRAFGGAADVVGQTMRAEHARGGTTVRVIGVLDRTVTAFDLNNPPPDLVGPGRPQTAFRDNELSWPIVRLPTGMTAEVGTAAISAALQGVAPAASGESREVSLLPLRAAQVNGGRPTAQVFLVGALSVLLLVAASLAHLLVTRAVARQAEFDTRAALGASRVQLARTLAVDSAALGAVGIGAGLLLGVWLSEIIAAAVPQYPTGNRNLALVAMAFDARTIGVAVLLGLVVLLLGAAWPVWRVWRRPWAVATRSATGASSGLSAPWSRTALVCEVAVATVIMCGTAFMGLGIWRYLNQPLGFEYEDRFGIYLEAGPGGDANGPDWQSVLSALRGTPGVTLAAIDGADTVGRVTAPVNRTGEVPFMAGEVDGAYFTTWGIRLVRGRGFRVDEIAAGAPVAVVNTRLAALAWPDEEAVGRRLRIDDGPEREVIGVVEDQRWLLDRDPWAMAFVPRRNPGSREVLVAWAPALRADELADRLRGPIAAVAPGYTVSVVEHTFDRLFLRGTGEALFQRPIVIVFGLFAFAVAGIGLFGLVSYLTSQRTRDFGVRIALGARPADLWRAVVRESLIPAAAGLAAGLVVAALLEDVVRASVFGWESSGPLAMAVVAVALMTVAIAAAIGPARRVLRIDPVVALRQE